jgi:TetR/AcrR family transcriptional regulator, mexJK operon transcriptional repressor
MPRNPKEPSAAPRAKAPTPARQAGPGRPKDLGKRAAILDAAKRLFVAQGYAGVSMDKIAAEAGVSKLTVYSHFGDKEALFAAAVRAYCDRQLPESLFAAADAAPLREGLLQIARAFFAMISSEESLASHRVMCTPQVVDSAMPALFWDAGPQRVTDAVAEVLRRHVDTGELAIDDVQLAASQFLCLAKGELHARMVFGCCAEGVAMPPAHAVEAQLEAAVDLFLRAFATGAR